MRTMIYIASCEDGSFGHFLSHTHVEFQNAYTYSEENKYLNTLLFCKFSHLEIMDGSEILIVGACPL